MARAVTILPPSVAAREPAPSRRSLISFFTGAVALAPLPTITEAAAPAPESDQVTYHPVDDDGLAPELVRGDIVTLDMADRSLSPPGIFLLRTVGGGLEFAAVEVVPNSSPLTVVVSTGGKAAQRALASTIRMEGRVVGVWRPTAAYVRLMKEKSNG